jgi:hypothetical protein
MIAQLRSELLKQRCTRTNPVLLPGWSGSLCSWRRARPQLRRCRSVARQHPDEDPGLGTSISALFAALLGATSITGILARLAAARDVLATIARSSATSPWTRCRPQAR